MGMTMAELTEAIRQHIDMEMDPEVACGMAEHALGFFGFYDRINRPQLVLHVPRL